MSALIAAETLTVSELEREFDGRPLPSLACSFPIECFTDRAAGSDDFGVRCVASIGEADLVVFAVPKPAGGR